ncbi:MAG: tetratricopeptide repeat protein [Bacteroidota bacterium]
MGKKKSDRLYFSGICIFLFSGLILTYSNHFSNPFHFDDDHTIVTNVWIRNTENIPKFFIDGTTSSSLPQNQGYRPGVTTLNTIDYWIASKDPFRIDLNPAYSNTAGLKPFYFHLSIFTCFILQAFLIFLLIKKIYDITHNNQWNKYIVLFAVAFYCFHSANAETINYIISRSDSFSTLMVVLSFVIYIYFPAKRKYHLHLLPYIFGFTVKEPTLMYAPLLYIYILLFEKQADLTKMFRKENVKKIFSSFIPVLPLIFIGIGLFLLNQIFTPKTAIPFFASRWNYMITQPFVIVHYFKTFFLPTELTVETDWELFTSIFNTRAIMGIMFVAGLIILAFRLTRKSITRPIAFGIFWFLIALLPTSSIIPLLEVLNYHRIYFPYIGLVISLSWTVYLLFFNNEKKILSGIFIKFGVVIFLTLLIIYHAYGTYRRNQIWSSDETLWYDATVKSPCSGRGLMNYGLTQMQKGNYIVAKEYFEKALVLSPFYSLLHINLAILHSALKDYETAEKYFKSAIEVGLYADQSYNYYGNFLFSQKRYDEAAFNLKKSIEMNPAYTEPRFTLMALYNDTEDWGALSRLAEGTLFYLPNDATCLIYIDAAKNKKTKLDVAIETAEQNPTEDNYINLSLKYYEDGQYEKCISACEEALKINPKNTIAYNNICTAYNQLKLFDKAITACNKALEIDSSFALAKGNLNHAKSQRNK